MYPLMQYCKHHSVPHHLKREHANINMDSMWVRGMPEMNYLLLGYIVK